MDKHEKTIHELNLEDDFLFAKVMTDKESAAGCWNSSLVFPSQK